MSKPRRHKASSNDHREIPRRLEPHQTRRIDPCGSLEDRRPPRTHHGLGRVRSAQLVAVARRALRDGRPSSPSIRFRECSRTRHRQDKATVKRRKLVRPASTTTSPAPTFFFDKRRFGDFVGIDENQSADRSSTEHQIRKPAMVRHEFFRNHRTLSKTVHKSPERCTHERARENLGDRSAEDTHDRKSYGRFFWATCPATIRSN
jgi:hypothetical protein